MAKRSEPQECVLKDGPKCPGVSGKESPYRYQTGCRGAACIEVNSNYYKKWRNKKKGKKSGNAGASDGNEKRDHKAERKGD